MDEKMKDVDVRTLAEDLHGRLADALQEKIKSFCLNMQENTYDFLEELAVGRVTVDADLAELACLVRDAGNLMSKNDELTRKLGIN